MPHKGRDSFRRLAERERGPVLSPGEGEPEPETVERAAGAGPQGAARHGHLVGLRLAERVTTGLCGESTVDFGPRADLK